MKKILVIGGAGYIGSHIVFKLCDMNKDVIIFDNMSSGQEINIDKRAEFVNGDILNISDLESVFEKNDIEVVFHFAAFKAAGESMEKPEKYSVNNITGSINVFNTMLKHDVKNIIFSSTAAVYGTPQYIPLDEKHPVNPENYYGFTKLKIEEILKWYSDLKSLNYAALRYFNAAGYDLDGRIKGLEQNPNNLFPIVLETLTGQREAMQVYGDDYETHDGTCIRDYIHVSDLADAHILAMDYILENQKSLLVNLGSEEGFTVLEVIKKAEEALNLKVNYSITGRRAGDPAKVVASAKKANDVLGWKAKCSDIETIVKTMWNVYNK